MKCRICGKRYEGHACPVCAFPLVHVPGGDLLELEKLRPVEESAREGLLKMTRISLPVYFWKENETGLTVEREELRCFGTASELRGTVCWLPGLLGRSREPELKLSLKISTCDRGEYRREIVMPNLQEASPRRLGAALDEDMNLRLTLRGASGAEVSSDWVPLFD